MPSLAASDIVKIASRMKYKSANDLVNVWHVMALGAVTFLQAELVTAVQGWLDAIFGSIITHIDSDVDPYDLKIDRVVWDAVNNREAVAENLYLGGWTMATNPSAAGEASALQLAVSVTMRTSRPQSRGRRFIGGLDTGFQADGGTVEASRLAQCVTMAGHMLDYITLNTVSLVPGIITAHDPDDHFLAFTSAIVSPTICTQRRRRKGVGS